MILAKRSRAAIGVRGGVLTPPPPFAVTKMEITLAFTKMFKLHNFPSERFVILKFLFYLACFSFCRCQFKLIYIKHTSI